MTKITNLPTFTTSYKALKENIGELVLVELYHQDIVFDPVVSVVSQLNATFNANDEGISHINLRIDGGTDLKFNSDNFDTGISDGAVVFLSKHDEGTYCVIDFMEKEVI